MVADPAPEIILASSSPRRRELLTQLGLSFRIVVPEVDETIRPGEQAHDAAYRTAVEKARWAAAIVGQASSQR